MKNVLKRSLSILLAITIIFSSAVIGLNEIDFSAAFAVKAEAASSGTCGDNLTWVLDDNGTLTISGEGEMTNYTSNTDVPWAGISSDIKTVIINNDVISIGDYAFYCCDNITSVTFGDSITKIGYNAFYNCTNLISISIPDSVKTIGSAAFYNCTNLISISIPDTVNTIGRWAFFVTGYYNDVNNWDGSVLYIGNHLVYTNSWELSGAYTIKQGTISIAEGAMSLCEELTSIIIPDSVINIGEFAFDNCTGLKSAIIPDSVINIGNFAFRNCSGLETLTIGDGVKNIGYNAFYECSNLTSITISDSVEIIGYEAFCGTGYYNDEANWEKDVLYIGNHLIMARPYLSGHYEIKDGTKTIAESAFQWVEGITAVTIPDSITTICDNVFSGCFSLESVYVSDINVWLNINFVNASSSPLFHGKYLYVNGEILTDVIIPNGIEKIPNGAFSYEGLESVIIPNSVKSIGESAFRDCYNIKSITIPEGVKEIGVRAFSECYALDSLSLPSSLACIGEGAFSGVTLEELYIYDLRNWCNIDFQGDYSSPLSGFTSDDVLLYINGELATEIVIPEGVTRIPSYAFSCDKITSVIIPDSVTSIDAWAFYDCSDLASISIPDSVKHIGYGALRGCKSLVSVVIPYGIEYIESDTFSSCANLEYVKIPDSVKGIGERAFSYCNNLTEITLPDGIKKIDLSTFQGCSRLASLVIPESVTIIEESAFANCDSFEYFIIPDSISVIGYGAFQGCLGLKTVKIGAGVTDIGDYAFYSCRNLNEVIFSDSVNKIGEYAFKNCPSLDSITIPENVKNIGAKAIGYDINNNKIEDFVIFGEYGSAAEKYANENGFAFKVVCNHPSTKWVTEKKATVNSAGKKVKKCTECGEVLETATIKQLKCSKPSLKKIENTADGVKITWGKVSGADKYYVYRKTGSSGKYSKIATVKGNSKVTYTDKKVKSGKKYYYIVKAVNEAGSSDASKAKSILYLADTTLKTPSSTKKGIVLKWSKVTGAEGYKVYRKTGSGSYEKIATVKGNSKVNYTDKKAKKGKTYTYKIKAYKSKTYSAYSNAKKIKDKY